jgi:ABC-type dipeptide/oligopeptide/nickel transport systems, permease components
VPIDPYADDLLNSLVGPSSEHWFGTDSLGRDIFSRVIVGSRDILSVAPLATIIGTILGTALGLVTGYFRGFIDDAVGRVVDAFLALPLVIIALLALVALGTSNTTVVVVIGVVFAPIIARTVRAAVLSERELDYVGSRGAARGERAPHHVRRDPAQCDAADPGRIHGAPGYAIFAVATLSFIGFGIQPPSADWGLAIADGYSYIAGGYWWTVLFDAVAIASLVVVGVNLLADGIQGALET